MAGLVEPFMSVANRVSSVAVIAHGHTLARVSFTPDETPYSFFAMVSQNVTERLLAERLQHGGATIEAEPSSPDGDAAAVTCRRRQPSSCMRPLVPG
jgi:hypothetical protein